MTTAVHSAIARAGRETSLAFEDVTFELPAVRGSRFTILKDFTLHVRAGEFCCIVGPSGAGKTSALVLAAGFAQPTRGRVLRASDASGGSRRRPAMVFQSDTVFPWMTVEGNLAFARRLGQRRNENLPSVEEILELTDLIRFRHFFPRQLSGGMRKRLELGRGWMCGSEVLLLDEPLGQLDYLSRQQQQHVLQNLWMRQPRSIVMVTHDLEEAAIMGDRVVVMAGSPGRVRHVEPIPFARPRRDDLRYDPTFQDLRRRIASQICGGNDDRL